MIAYSILAALRSEHVSRVVVSTDDEEIARISREWGGAEVPFMRPAELAQDHSTDYPPVIVHALEWLAEHENYHPDVVVQLRPPTSPVRPTRLVDDAIDILLAHPEADSVRGVVPSAQNPFKMWTIDPDTGEMKTLLTVPGIKEPYNAPRQALPDTFWQTGHIDAIRVASVFEKSRLVATSSTRFTLTRNLPWILISPPATGRLLKRPCANWPLKLWTRLICVVLFLPDRVFLVMDFDGVFTDNRVIVDENGLESVRADRSDGLGFGLLKAQTPVECMIISKERNLVVAQRAKKTGYPCFASD